MIRSPTSFLIIASILKLMEYLSVAGVHMARAPCESRQQESVLAVPMSD